MNVSYWFDSTMISGLNNLIQWTFPDDLHGRQHARFWRGKAWYPPKPVCFSGRSCGSRSLIPRAPWPVSTWGSKAGAGVGRAREWEERGPAASPQPALFCPRWSPGFPACCTSRLPRNTESGAEGPGSPWYLGYCRFFQQQGSVMKERWIISFHFDSHLWPKSVSSDMIFRNIPVPWPVATLRNRDGVSYRGFPPLLLCKALDLSEQSLWRHGLPFVKGEQRPRAPSRSALRAPRGSSGHGGRAGPTGPTGPSGFSLRQSYATKLQPACFWKSAIGKQNKWNKRVWDSRLQRSI